jgi:hypothetical protein
MECDPCEHLPTGVSQALQTLTFGMQANAIYVDVNAIRDLAEGRICKADAKLKVLQESISSNRLIIVPSLECLAEVLFILPHDESVYKKVYRLYCEIADWHHLLRDAADILKEDIVAFAQTGEPAAPFAKLDASCSFMQAVATGQEMLPRDLLLDIVNRSRERNQQFVGNAFDPRRMDHPRARYSEADFLTLWEPGHTAEVMASSFAERLGVLDECRDRGLMNLLTLPTLRMCIGYILHTWYKQLCSNAKPAVTCAYDFRHAVLAGAVGTIVTEDKKLRNAIAAVPGHNIRAWSLGALTSRFAQLANREE